MLSDIAVRYMRESNMNCAEAILYGANGAYGLELPDTAFRLIAGYGGGLGAGKTCGAILGAVAVLSYLRVGKSAHETEGFRADCKALTERLEAAFGATDCNAIKPVFRRADTGCQNVVETVGELLEAYLNERAGELKKP